MNLENERFYSIIDFKNDKDKVLDDNTKRKKEIERLISSHENTIITLYCNEYEGYEKKVKHFEELIEELNLEYSKL